MKQVINFDFSFNVSLNGFLNQWVQLLNEIARNWQGARAEGDIRLGVDGRLPEDLVVEINIFEDEVEYGQLTLQFRASDLYLYRIGGVRPALGGEFVEVPPTILPDNLLSYRGDATYRFDRHGLQQAFYTFINNLHLLRDGNYSGFRKAVDHHNAFNIIVLMFAEAPRFRNISLLIRNSLRYAGGVCNIDGNLQEQIRSWGKLSIKFKAAADSLKNIRRPPEDPNGSAGGISVIFTCDNTSEILILLEEALGECVRRLEQEHRNKEILKMNANPTMYESETIQRRYGVDLDNVIVGSILTSIAAIGVTALVINKSVLKPIINRATKAAIEAIWPKMLLEISAKATAKKAGPSLAKKIPVVGALIGIGLGIGRAAGGDWGGAAGEAASGILGMVPGAGTAASVGIDLTLLGRDIALAEEAFKRECNEWSQTIMQAFENIERHISALEHYKQQLEHSIELVEELQKLIIESGLTKRPNFMQSRRFAFFNREEEKKEEIIDHSFSPQLL